MPIDGATALIARLAPGGAPVRSNEPLVEDDSVWFVRAGRRGVGAVPAGVRRTASGTARGVRPVLTTSTHKPRHLFSRPDADVAQLNREYVPHIAAYGRAVLDYGYDRSSFSLYRKFTRDLIVKRAGQSYETDAEFYMLDGAVCLRVEAKADARKTDRLSAQAQVSSIGELRELPAESAKELEYVLDLSPAFLSIVGPRARRAYRNRDGGYLRARPRT